VIQYHTCVLCCSPSIGSGLENAEKQESGEAKCPYYEEEGGDNIASLMSARECKLMHKLVQALETRCFINLQ